MKHLSPGLYKIQPSLNSPALSLIKIQKRPRKVNLPCKCHFTIHHECHHGFSHGTTYYPGTSDEINTNNISSESTLLQTTMVREIRNDLSTQSPDEIQPQPPQIAQPTQVLDRYDDHWITQDIDWRPFFESLEEPSRQGNQKTIFSLN
uniref:Pathogenicity-associated protein n=1 Tax=Beet curly top virus TaxID=10840 RepID=A0A125R9Z5_9GEMI|nr:pathogenicity-associated protein [Beet curly top virus]AMD16534.1 pathogenicity-associated protein [Beet curly top virus]WGU24674.1 pathogenesis enhancement protein [Beet curly top virus]